MKTLMVVVLSVLSLSALAADYDYLDPGDYYYINRWTENEYVVVVRKLQNNKVKVRDINTGSTQIVDASQLLTKSELELEELENAAGAAAGAAVIGFGIIYCLANPDECKH